MSWPPTTRAFFLDQKKYHKDSRVNRAKRYHEKKNARIQDQLDDIGINAGSTGNIDQMILFAAAQNRAMQERWEAVQASETPRRLQIMTKMKKTKAVDFFIK